MIIHPQIAADTGFCDLPHLIRGFRAAEGKTPDVYRQAQAQA
jgi:transcriptional regulator GlxA family with amidase domain